METCKLCGVDVTVDEEVAMQACRVCADKIGLRPMPPPIRPARPCARCNGMKFVRVIPREHSTVRTGDGNSQVSAPMFLTHVAKGFRGWVFSGVHELEIERGFGMLEVYACWQCGAVEWYARDVQQIPIHPHFMTDVVDYDGEGPYR
jgi:hypothetical protein